MSDVQAVARDQLRSFIERIERLEEEKKTISDDIKDVKAEAKGCGFDITIINAIIKLRKKSAEERAEQDAILDTYMVALGMLPEPFEEDEPEAGDIDPKLAHTIVTGMQTEIGRAALVTAIDIMIEREEQNSPPDAAPASAAALSSSRPAASGEEASASSPINQHGRSAA